MYYLTLLTVYKNMCSCSPIFLAYISLAITANKDSISMCKKIICFFQYAPHHIFGFQNDGNDEQMMEIPPIRVIIYFVSQLLAILEFSLIVTLHLDLLCSYILSSGNSGNSL